MTEEPKIALDPNLFGQNQRCFGCGPNNESGMQLKFFRQGDAVVTTFTPKEGWEGPPGVVHGGLQATLADELGAWTVVGIVGHIAVTTSMQVRYVRPVRIDRPTHGRGVVVRQSEGGIVTVRVTLTQDGKRVLGGKISYATPTEAQAERIMGKKIPENWRHLVRPG